MQRSAKISKRTSSSSAKRAAQTKLAGSRVAIAKGSKSAKSAASKASSRNIAGSYVLSAPNGPRTLSHRRIKAAVEKVFRERAYANG